MTLLIKTTSLTGFCELVTRLNGNPDALLRRFNIDPAKVRKLEGVLPYRTKINLIEVAARELDCPDFGLRLAMEQDLTIFGSLATVALSAPTVGEALRKIAHYLRYYSPGTCMSLEHSSGDKLAQLKFEMNEQPASMRQQIELTLALANNALRMLCGDDFRAEVITMKASVPLEHYRYREVFKAPVQFGSESDALIFDAEKLDLTIDTQSPVLYELLGEYISETLESEPLDLIHQVKQLVYRLLPTLRCNLQEVANQLGLHKRTLQRRLNGHAIVFEDLLDDIRRERADAYLSEPELPMTQITELLGYREQSSFNRACRRWFGTTPLKKRSQLQTSALAEKVAPASTDPEAGDEGNDAR